MLLKDFYTIISIETTDVQKHQVSIVINKNHEIFKGHFPETPVVPGVCMLQIIKELAENITNQKLVLQKLVNVKFLTLMNPEVNSNLVLELEIITTDDSLIKVKYTTIFNETIALKMSAIYNIKTY